MRTSDAVGLKGMSAPAGLADKVCAWNVLKGVGVPGNYWSEAPKPPCLATHKCLSKQWVSEFRLHGLPDITISSNGQKTMPYQIEGVSGCAFFTSCTVTVTVALRTM